MPTADEHGGESHKEREQRSGSKHQAGLTVARWFPSTWTGTGGRLPRSIGTVEYRIEIGACQNGDSQLLPFGSEPSISRLLRTES